ncbi:restriction endonuclease subunit S [Paenibacillus sp. Soil724D2]|uniref:restriction endonuclease subunit S n=1 Tax=Paenibacillus sp. (strain Soil724D2) TaxID=1736392 RepID=UPI000714DE10|nr:restriction endonuclease subunit S [Paenibacillus sp. Soil724D2]KRE48374.1 hypothetical protein ASG85_05065 [Paenibacillus sp. Soil724D2]
MIWRKVKLEDIAEINPRTDISKLNEDSIVSVLPMSFISEEGKIIQSNTSKLSEVTKGLTSFSEYDVLLAKITPCMENGKRAIARGLENGVGFGSTEFHVLRAKEQVLPEFIYFYIGQKSFRKEAELNMTGSAGQKRVPTNFLKNKILMLPSLDIQNKIVAALNEANELIQRRKEVIAKLDELIQSIFLDMFGDPLTNPKGWKTTYLENVVLLQRGFDLPVSERDASGTIEVWGSNGILGYHSESKIKGGGLITGRSGSIGNVYYTLNDFWALNTTLFSKESYGNDIIYLTYLLRMFKLDRFFNGTGVPTLNRNIIHKEEIYDIPLDLQKRFSSIVTEIDAQKKLMEQQLRMLEENFQSLLHQAFSGQLQLQSEGEIYAAKC